ncbi:large ribosomal subunit protein mL37 [Lethenteron reissneri]|uniref:large ribosomal subunit protein mL37 n=1 Tax=Lethenteron reissneri TaxID=7753 RepID=UPI002AB617B2|nr:large ribosomal subunit protein mL37 [Lethenteron reissneri]
MLRSLTRPCTALTTLSPSRLSPLTPHPPPPLAAHPAVSSPRLFSASSSSRGRRADITRRWLPPAPSIPGLERVSYGSREHFVPGLAHPPRESWERGWLAPRQGGRRATSDNAAVVGGEQQQAFVFHPRTQLVEGERQALWLTKSVLRPGLPPSLQALVAVAKAEAEAGDLSARALRAVEHARLWDLGETRPPRQRFCEVLWRDLMTVCHSLAPRYPGILERSLVEGAKIGVSWQRGPESVHARGPHGAVLVGRAPLGRIASPEETESASGEPLPDFSPISPLIDLQRVHVTHTATTTGIREGFPYPHAHTLFLLEGLDECCRLSASQLRAKMLVFSFAHALAQARALYGEAPLRSLPVPVVVQSVATNGRVFHFSALQLNTTELRGGDGPRNAAWTLGDQLLYDFAKTRPLVHKRLVQVPVGVSGFNPSTFYTFLAFFLNGAL